MRKKEAGERGGASGLGEGGMRESEREREREREKEREREREREREYMLGESVCHGSALVMQISAICKAL